MRQLSGNLLPVFEKVLSPPAEQLDDETRDKVKQIVRHLYEAEAGLFANAPAVLRLAGLA